MSPPDPVIHQLQTTCSHRPSLAAIQIGPSGQLRLHLYWITDKQLPREADIHFQGVTRVDTSIRPVAGYQTLGLHHATRSPDGRYTADFTLDGTRAITVDFHQARTYVTLTPDHQT